MKTHSEAVEEFQRHENRGDGARVVGSLAGGLTVLRDLLYTRTHDDVETNVGRDSMFLPVSDEKTERSAKAQIEIYQIAESTATVRQRAYVRTHDDWYPQWLMRLRLGRTPPGETITERIARYLAESSDDRRLAFGNALADVLPESNRAPLVLFRLVPLGVWLATAQAFGDHGGAAEARNGQLAYLPVIGDCQQCHGAVLENGEQCPGCGNPLWKFEWLTTAD